MMIVTKTISLGDLKIMASAAFGNLVKAVVDVARGCVAIDAELHSDLEGLLLDDGSLQHDLWGINLYPDLSGDDFIEFDSMINMRPSQGNMTRGVDAAEIREKIKAVVSQRIAR